MKAERHQNQCFITLLSILIDIKQQNKVKFDCTFCCSGKQRRKSDARCIVVFAEQRCVLVGLLHVKIKFDSLVSKQVLFTDNPELQSATSSSGGSRGTGQPNPACLQVRMLDFPGATEFQSQVGSRSGLGHRSRSAKVFPSLRSSK